MELKEYKLGDIAEISTGYPFDSNLYAKEGIRVLRGENIGDGILKWDDRIDKRWNAPFSKSDVYTLCDGDIVMQMDGNVGRNKSRVFAPDLPMLIAQRVGCIRAKKEIADQDFLYYVICSERYLRYINKVKTGTSIHHISLSQISNYTLSIPPLITQKRIADVLSSFDKQIALNKQINQNLEALARQLYDYWFVQFDFPNEEGKPYKSSGGKMVYNTILKREIPEGWEVKTINEIAQSTRGVTYNKSDLVNQGVDSILVLRGNNIEGNSLVYDGNVAYVPHTLVAASQRIKKFDIIMTMSSGSKAHIGKCVLFNYDSLDTFGAFLNKFSAPQEYAYLLFLHFISNEFKSKIQSICNGTGINNLTNESFNHILLPTANEEIRKHFKAVCAPIFDSIGKNELEIVSLTKQRDELLPLLMNGQVNFDLSDD